MKKKIFSILLCLCMVFALASCRSADAGKAESGDKGFVGITTSMYTNEGLTLLCDTIKERLETEGYEVVIKDADTDQAQQTKDVEDFISQGADLIVVEACDSVGVKSAFELCNAANIPVLSVNQILDESLLDMTAGSVTSDNYKAGYAVGEAVAEALEHKGTLTMLTYDVAFVCRERGEGFKEAVSQYPEIQIMEIFDGVCTEDEAMKKTEDWLQQYPDISAIFGNNSNCGIGISAAVRAAGKTESILVANVDGLSGDIRNMEDGALDITAVYPMKEMAQEAADRALQILDTGTCDEDPHMQFNLCTQDKIETYKEYWGIK